ncbi:hypothetical protein [Klebsiella pneumoniae]|uniref:hypothetical protein n=1 Tax=Klebsiella pneumoniae TaxID=573 RepID=UPI0024A80861|nr:hypothetical protein [Klebsiella pneumoniae]HDO7098920.1 hypothetical protein [Klebsiella pneumoniae]
MFKPLFIDTLPPVLFRVFWSGWLVSILVVSSLLLCSLYGRQAFAVWGMTFSGVMLVCSSVTLGNLPYRLLRPARPVGKLADAFSWVIWAVGTLLITFAPLMTQSILVGLLSPFTMLTAWLLWQWLSRKEPFKWTR